MVKKYTKFNFKINKQIENNFKITFNDSFNKQTFNKFNIYTNYFPFFFFWLVSIPIRKTK